MSGVTGYASAPSVGLGETIDFRVSLAEPGPVTVTVHRVGWYDGAGRRTVHPGETVEGYPQAPPQVDPDTGLVTCAWRPTWTLTIPTDWSSGLYLAEFQARDGRAFAPFVVRDDDRRAELCVVLPFLTYQAENRWPDGEIGRSLCYGLRDGVPSTHHRAVKVGLDRPYSGDGRPERLDDDRHAIAWLEEQGYDAVYVTDFDIHTGRVDLSRFVGLIFPGRTEYWSRPMRDALAAAIGQGVSAAFLSSRNLYWHIRFEPAGDRPDRVIVCYKERPDPDPRIGMATIKWRIPDPGPGQAEQELLGTQFIAPVRRPTPLVVSAADHWFWSGTGVRDGDAIDDLVVEAADGHDRRYPTPPGMTQTLLATSPLFITDQGEQRIHHTSVCETPSPTSGPDDGTGGPLVFTAGTPRWARALGDPDHRDERIRRATANLVERMLLLPKLWNHSLKVSLAVENLRGGSGRWRVGTGDAHPTSGYPPQIEGYASRPSVSPGERLDFFVRSREPFTIAVHRIGHYGGLGSRLVVTSPVLPPTSQPEPTFAEATRRSECAWRPSWHVEISEGWTTGLYLAAFTTVSNRRILTPFVVTDPHPSAPVGVVLPFLTYQATNRWPLDGVHGTSLALGYVPGNPDQATFRTRAVEVSFDRPYAQYGGIGLTEAMLVDVEVVSWLEEHGHDVAYLTDVDLHEGRVDLDRFSGLFFVGQHEYWTRAMRARVTAALARGTSLVFSSAGTAYWHARLQPAADGRPNRILACYKFDPDPHAPATEATTRWRARPGPNLPEQLLTGTGLIGRAAGPTDLVVSAAQHWVWAGVGVDDGTTIAGLVNGQCDGMDPAVGGPGGTRTILAASPFRLLGKGTEHVQQTTIHEWDTGTFVFSAGTEEWWRRLAGEQADKRVQAATTNLLHRLARRATGPLPAAPATPTSAKAATPPPERRSSDRAATARPRPVAVLRRVWRGVRRRITLRRP